LIEKCGSLNAPFYKKRFKKWDNKCENPERTMRSLWRINSLCVPKTVGKRENFLNFPCEAQNEGILEWEKKPVLCPRTTPQRKIVPKNVREEF